MRCYLLSLGITPSNSIKMRLSICRDVVLESRPHFDTYQVVSFGKCLQIYPPGCFRSQKYDFSQTGSESQKSSSSSISKGFTALSTLKDHLSAKTFLKLFHFFIFIYIYSLLFRGTYQLIFFLTCIPKTSVCRQ